MGKRTDSNTINKLISLLPTGEENAVHQKELANYMGVDCCTLKKIIQGARKDGYKIISSQQGYFKPKDKAEIIKFINHMSKQAATRYGSITKLKRVAGETDGQITLLNDQGETGAF